MSDNMWGRFSQAHYIHPHLGEVKFTGDGWLATPRNHLDHNPRMLPSKKEAMEWLQSLS